MGLKKLRDFYAAHYGKNLSDSALMQRVILSQDIDVRNWLNRVFGMQHSKK